MKKLERLLKALASHRRLSILSELKKKKSSSVGIIARSLRLSLHATSKHLRILMAVNLIDYDRRGMEVHYELVEEVPFIAQQVIDVL